MRIVLISTPIGFLGSGKGGGVELTLNSLVSGLLSLGHSVEVIAPKNSKLSKGNEKAKVYFVDGKDQITEIADLFSVMANQVSIIKQKTLSSIGDLGVNVVETGETVPLLEREAKRVREGLIVG